VLADANARDANFKKLQWETKWACNNNMYWEQCKTPPTEIEIGVCVQYPREGNFVVVGFSEDQQQLHLYKVTFDARVTLAANISGALHLGRRSASHTIHPYRVKFCTRVHDNLVKTLKCPTCQYTLDEEHASVKEFLYTNGGCAPLQEMHWMRIVLDESHKIAALNTKISNELVTGLRADRKWCMTGTPMPCNAVTNLYGQLRFLDVDVGIFKRTWQWYLLGSWVKDCMIRHIKSDMAVKLPGVNFRNVKLEMSAAEGLAYKAQRQKTLAYVETLATANDRVANTVAIFSLINAERMSCSVATLQNTETGEVILPDETVGVDECPVCLETVPQVSGFPCGHTQCQECLKTLLEGGQTVCPLCRVPGVQVDMWAAANKSKGPGVAGGLVVTTSIIPQNQSKLDALLSCLDENTTPALVFTQFNMCIEVVKSYLTTNGYAVSTLAGFHTESQRATAVRTFVAVPAKSVLILSLRAASFGLNLTHAKRAIFIDFPWNEGMAKQAIGRLHRLGQDRVVDIVHLIYANTVEERIKGYSTVEELDMHSSAGTYNVANVQVLVSEAERRERRYQQLQALIG